MHTHLDWLVDMVKKHGVDVAKTIIFCNTLKEIAIVVNNLFVKLGESKSQMICSLLLYSNQ